MFGYSGNYNNSDSVYNQSGDEFVYRGGQQ